MAKIIFFGTPQVSCPALKKLLEAGHEILAVFTKEPKESGRGMKLQPSPVHSLALESGLKVYTPKTLKSADMQEFFSNISYDFSVIVAYGLLLPKHVLDAPKYGSINIHPSDLPKYRGAAPIQHTILNGEKQIAVCTMLIDEGMDSGDILMRKYLDLKGDEASSYLHDKLFDIGADLLIDTIENFKNIQPIKQDHSKACLANKFDKDFGKVNLLNDDVDIVYNKVRALNPWPGVYFELEGEKIKIISANKSEAKLVNLIVQRPGKKPMGYDEMLRGLKSGK